MPFISYSGHEDRVKIGGRYFYKDRKKRQTPWGDHVSDKFIGENLEPLTKNNCIIYQPDKVEEEKILFKLHSEQEESMNNRSELQRVRDLRFLRTLELCKDVDIVSKPYRKDEAFMKIAKTKKEEIKKLQSEIRERGKVIKSIFGCKSIEEVDLIAKEHEKDKEIQEAVESKKKELNT